MVLKNKNFLIYAMIVFAMTLFKYFTSKECLPGPRQLPSLVITPQVIPSISVNEEVAKELKS